MSTKKLQIIGSLGNNDADTLDGKHAIDFASATDFEELKTLVGDVAVSKQIDTAIQESVETKMNKHNPEGTGSFSLNRKSDTQIGEYSFAEGYNNTASNTYSHAEGENTVASGISSHAEGGSCEARGDYSHAEGCNNGDTKTTTSGIGAHAEGRGTTASGSGSHSEGVGTAASKEGSHAEGKGTTSNGEASHAEGNGTVSSALGTHAEGVRAQATANASHAEGMDTIASDSSAHAEGYNTRAQGDASHSEGNSTVSSGNSSHAEGKLSTASGNFSHAEGHNTSSTGEASHTEGRYTNAVGVGSHAEGGYLRQCFLEGTAGRYKVYDSKTTEMPSWLSGYYYDAGEESAIDGQPMEGVKIYNDNYEHIGTITKTFSVTGDDLYIIVEGITDTLTVDSESIFLIAWSKAEGTSSHSEGGGLAIGNFSHAEGSMTWAAHQSHAEGHMSASMNTGSHAEGIRTRAHGQASHSEGNKTFAKGKASHAEGYDTQANGDYSHVQGRYNIVDENNAYAHIVGNGTDSISRSNAHTIDWNGMGWFAGGLKVGGTGQDDEAAQEIVTKDYVVELVGDTKVSEQISAAIQESVADWSQTDPAAVDYIKNKPDIAIDDEIIDLLMQEDMLPAITDSDGSLLSDEGDNILLW